MWQAQRLLTAIGGSIMNKLVCDICGGKIKMLPGGTLGECENCGTQYPKERLQEIYSGMKVSITGTKEDVEQWKELCEKYIKNCDYEAAEKIVKKILEASPSDTYANSIYDKLLDWKFYEVKNGVLVKYHGKSVETTIPHGIVNIGESAFSECESVKKVIISDNVMQISKEAFLGCKSLIDINLPEGLKRIGENAFSGCESLVKITIPSSVTHYERNVFGSNAQKDIKSCLSLLKVIINSEADINNSMFNGCLKLQEVQFSKAISAIGSYAFINCDSLRTIVLKNGLKTIGSMAFYGCINLEKIIIPKSVANIGYEAFKNCLNLKGITIPDSVTKIEKGVFEQCVKLEKITIPDNVTEIEYNAFCGCTNLKKVHFKGTPQIHNDAFKKTPFEETLNYRIANNKCQWCGGSFPIFGKTCKSCGRPKDY